MPDSTTHTSPRGKRLVATLLTIGIVAGIVAVCYWKWGVRVDADALKRDIAALESKIETMRAAPNLDNEAKLQIDQLVLERNRLQALLDKALPAGQKALDADLATKELAQLEDDFAQAKQVRRIKPMIARCEAFVAKYPAYPPAYTMLAKVYIELYDWPTALELLMKSLKLDPQQPMVHHLAGTVHYEMKQYEQAEQHYLSARTLSPKDPLHMVYLAQVYIRTGKQDAAMVELLRALDLNSQFHEAYATMSDLYMHQNDATRALQQIDKAMTYISLDKREVVVPYIRKRAAVLRRLGDPEAAMHDLPRYAALAAERDAMEARLKAAAGVIVVGAGSPRLAGTSNFALPGFRAETQVMAMDLAAMKLPIKVKVVARLGESLAEED